MSVILIRSLILYVLVIFAVRLMGKRQLGELQPSELVITILVSNIATLPIEDVNIPVLVGITPIFAMVCFEVTVSWLCLRFPTVRRFISGSPKIVIRGGRIDRQAMADLRFSVDDLMMALRGSEVFDLAEVQYAIVETTGSMSVMRKPSADTPTRGELGVQAEDSDPPLVIVSDGIVLHTALRSLGFDSDYADRTARRFGLKASDIFIMTADSSGSCFISPRDGGRPIITQGGDESDKAKNQCRDT
ncbi:MAG: DUF421 domain-containing protein [Ruminococcus sp.]|nr:DUF421 domain-containing protein [Ruminococcus sp.]